MKNRRSQPRKHR